MKKIVVLTGSFNPITKAHRILLEKAISKVNAEFGLFVMTNDSYLLKKNLVDSKEPTAFHLSEAVRKEMIDSLSNLNPKLKFGGIELGNESPSTVRTLKHINKIYKDYKIFYIVGADKLHNISHWKDFDKVFNEFGFVVFQRRGIDIDAIISNDKLLNENKENIYVMDNIEETNEISSTEIRNRFFEDKDYSDLMDEGPKKVLNRFTPIDFRKPTSEDIIKATIQYGGRFGGNAARLKAFKANNALFKNWNDSLLGNKNDLVNGTKIYNKQFKLGPNTKTFETCFECANEDCATIAETLINQGFNPVILNLASGVNPCGGYNKGLNAQEESLCYMSTLSQSLYQFGSLKYKHVRESGLPNFPNIYPLDLNFGGIYSPKVTFFRNNLDKYYSLRENPFSCSIISVASLKKENDNCNDQSKYFNLDGSLNSVGREIESNKIRTIFRIALLNNHDSIVLGAFGCGAYNLLPSDISRLFKEIIEEDEFKNRFRKVSFAIYEGKGSKRKIVGKDGKFKPFYHLFGGYVG